MKKAIIIGATSGIGQEVARILVQQGWRIGIAGRREDVLLHMQQAVPGQIEIQCLDVTKNDAALRLNELIDRLGGNGLVFTSSGWAPERVRTEIELNTARTNVEVIRMVTAVFHPFQENRWRTYCVISSIAGTKGLGVAPAYSATKRFQNTYIDALAQLSRMQRLNIRFTDIRPGFVATDLLRNGKYPMLMRADKVALCIVRSLERKKRTVIIDRRYRLLVFFWRMIPRWLWERLPIKN